MALRVLLADESATIKKVIQLALQDFAVEVKAVPIGLDVLQVARNFKPDLVLADILLSKKNGYEVCAELKNDPTLSKIPVVLMWSGFMELDEAKARSCRADQRLEKPFDADTLRGLVRQLVPPTQENVISNYLTFPELPSMVEEERPTPKAPSATGKVPSIPSLPSNLLGMGEGNSSSKSPRTNSPMNAANTELDEPEEFQAVPLPKNRDLSKFKIELPKEDVSMDEFEEIDLSKTNIALSSGGDDISLDQIDRLTHLEPVTTNSPRSSTSLNYNSSYNSQSIDPAKTEHAINAQVRQVVEEIAWKILPDVVERVVREEIQKLMKDAERL